MAGTNVPTSMATASRRSAAVVDEGVTGQHDLGHRKNGDQGQQGQHGRADDAELVVPDQLAGLEMPHEDGRPQHQSAGVEDQADHLAAGLPGQRQPEQGVDDDADRGAVDGDHRGWQVGSPGVRVHQHVGGLDRRTDPDQGADHAQVLPETAGGGGQTGGSRRTPQDRRQHDGTGQGRHPQQDPRSHRMDHVDQEPADRDQREDRGGPQQTAPRPWPTHARMPPGCRFPFVPSAA